MATATPSQGPLGLSLEEFLLPPSAEPEEGGESANPDVAPDVTMCMREFLLPLSPEPQEGGESAKPDVAPDVAICVREFLRSFDLHRIAGEPGLDRSRRHARFFRRGRRRAGSSDPLHAAVWDLLRDVAAVTELAVDVHLRELFPERSTPIDLPLLKAVSFTQSHEPYSDS